MPIYEYRCSDCGQVFEEWQKDFKDREMVCPVCGGASERLISSTSFVLKGSGWYVTDYCNKHTSPPSSNGDTKESATSDTAASATPAAADTTTPS